ncbi:MAG: hypothetical protein CMJ88_05620 [Planctomycetes bacterium]|nr:hypothetical protein [Planctomycetota bacterium]
MTSPAQWREVEQVTRGVLDAVDWHAMGEIYFHEDGAQHWSARRQPVVELGIQLARRLALHVPQGGASLWVGAGVAELPVLIAEQRVLGRAVTAANLIAEECALLNAALAQAAPQAAVRYEAGDAVQVAGERRYDHVGCVSVFTDPERWPMLSGVSYGRMAPVQLQLEQFAAEREDARALAAALVARLTPPGCVTTSAEEVAWFLEQCDALGLASEAADELVETAVVGDPVGFLKVRAR